MSETVFLQPIVGRGEALFAGGLGFGEVVNFSQSPRAVVSDTRTDVRVVEGVSLAEADAIASGEADAELLASLFATTDTSGVINAGTAIAFADASAEVVASFPVAGGEVFSFDFDLSTDLFSSEIDDPATAFTAADIVIGFDVIDTSDAARPVLLGYVEQRASLVSSEGFGEAVVDYDILTPTGSLDIASDGDVDLNNDNGTDAVVALSFGTYTETLAADGEVTIVKYTTNLVDVRGDPLIGDLGANVAYGTMDADALVVDGAAYGGLGDDVIVGGGGPDILEGGQGGDQLSGDAGDDSLSGGKGDDLLDGGDGDDHLFGSAGRDSIDGGPGDDRLHGDGLASEAAAPLLLRFESEDAYFQNSVGWYDKRSLDAGIVIANVDTETNPGLADDVFVLPFAADALDDFGFFLIPDGYRQNAAPGEPLADPAGQGARLEIFADGDAWKIRDADTGFVFDGANAPAWFSDAAMNGDGRDHVRISGDLAADGAVTYAWEDWTNLGDRDFNDTVFSLAAGPTPPAAPDPNAISPANADTFLFDGAALGHDVVVDFTPGTDELQFRNVGAATDPGDFTYTVGDFGGAAAVDVRISFAGLGDALAEARVDLLDVGGDLEAVQAGILIA